MRSDQWIHASFYAFLALSAAAFWLTYRNDLTPTHTAYWLAIAALITFTTGMPAFVVRHSGLLKNSLEQAPTRPSAAPDTFRNTLEQAQAEAGRAKGIYPELAENTHHDWLRAASEELGECSKTIHNGGMTEAEMQHLRGEIVQLAATALNWAAHADFSPTSPGQRA